MSLINVVCTPDKFDVDIFFIHDTRHWQSTYGRQEVKSARREKRRSLSPFALSSFRSGLRHQSRSREPVLTDIWELREWIPTARIVTWGLQLPESVHFAGGKLSRHARALLNDYRRFREDATHKVIFVAYSAAGLLVKQALCVLGRGQPASFRHVQGVVFLGTPHLLGSSAAWADYLHKVDKVQSKLNVGPFVRTFSNLETLGHEFAQLVANSDSLHILYVREAPNSSGLLVIPEDAAIMAGDRVTTITADTDHVGLAKLNASRDRHFAPIMQQLTSMASNPIPTQTQDDHPETILTDRTGLHGPDPLVMRSLSYAVGDTHVSGMDGREQLLKLLDGIDTRTLESALQLHDQARYRFATQNYRKLIAKFESSHDPTSMAIKLFCEDKIASILCAEGRYQDCDSLCRKVLQGKREWTPHDHASILRTARTYAMLLRRRGAYLQAFRELSDYLESANISSHHWERIKTLELLAKLLKDMKQYVIAEYLLRESMEMAVSAYGLDVYTHLLSQLSELSTLSWLRGQHRRAEQASRYAFYELRKELGPDDLTVLRAAKRHANHLRYQGRLREANKLQQDTLERMKIHLNSEHPALLWTICGIAAVHILRGYIAEGVHLLEGTTAIYERKHTEFRHNERDMAWTRLALELVQGIKIANGNVWPYFLPPQELPAELVAFLHRPSQPASMYLSGKQPFLDKQTLTLLGSPRSSGAAGHMRAAAFNGDTETVRTYIAEAKNGELNTQGGYYGTLLHAAAFQGDLSLVNLLLESGANPMIEAGLFVSPMKAAIVRGHVHIVERLLIYQQSLPRQAEKKVDPYMTNLEVAILVERERIVEMLLTGGEDPNLVSPLFANALCQAAPTGNFKVVQALLEHQAEINQMSPFALSPLVEVGQAAGDAMQLDDDSAAEFLGQLDSNVQQKQEQTLDVFSIMLEEVKKQQQEATITVQEVNQMVGQALKLVDQPLAQAETFVPSSEDVDDLLNDDLRIVQEPLTYT